MGGCSMPPPGGGDPFLVLEPSDGSEVSAGQERITLVLLESG